MYSFEQLKIFVAVCEYGSFSAAARKLKRAQSGVSQAISNLEITIDQELFSREKNTPQLTESGKALLPIAKSILHQQNHFDQKVNALTNEYEHELVIAVDESLIDSTLLRILQPFSDKFPSTNFEVIATSTFEVEALIRNGKAHIGIVYADGELKVDMDFFVLGQARFLTVSAPDHELAQQAVVTEGDLKRYRQCVHRSQDKQELWFTYGISTNMWYANTHQTLVDLVAQGVGWANVPQSMVASRIASGELTHLAVTHEIGGWLTAVGCLVSRSQPNGPVLSAVVDELQTRQFVYEHWQ